MNIYIWLLAIVIACVVAWNVYPPLRERLRGWSTIAEGAIGTLMAYFGVFAEALEEGQASGYIPENISTYIPIVLFAWIVIKRLQTRSKVGAK